MCFESLSDKVLGKQKAGLCLVPNLCLDLELTQDRSDHTSLVALGLYLVPNLSLDSELILERSDHTSLVALGLYLVPNLSLTLEGSDHTSLVAVGLCHDPLQCDCWDLILILL